LLSPTQSCANLTLQISGGAFYRPLDLIVIRPYNTHYYAHLNALGKISMKSFYDSNAPKKPTNLSINSDLLKKTKSLNINLSATLEQALNDILANKVAAQWRSENKNAIAAYNEFVDENGLFSDEYRVF